MEFGDGQLISIIGIPEITLITAVDYLWPVDAADNAHKDKCKLEVIYKQPHTFARCIMRLDEKSKKEIGRSQPYSFGIGRLK